MIGSFIRLIVRRFLNRIINRLSIEIYFRFNEREVSSRYVGTTPGRDLWIECVRLEADIVGMGKKKRGDAAGVR